MSIPTRIAIDTSVFRQHAYNFNFGSLMGLREYCTRTGSVVLLPEPIEREIHRHIHSFCEEAANSLLDAQRKLPSIRQIPEWKFWSVGRERLVYRLREVAFADLHSFLKDVHVERLGYDGLRIQPIMDAYDKCAPPFAPGSRKEFPDAIFVQMLKDYSALDLPVAVLTLDRGITNACEPHFHLHAFGSIAEFLSASNEQDSAMYELKQSLEGDLTNLDEAIAQAFENSPFSIREDWDGDVGAVRVKEVTYDELGIVSIGQKDCTVIFQAKVAYKAKVRYSDYSGAIYDREDERYYNLSEIESQVYHENVVNGICKWEFEGKPRQLGSVRDLELDQSGFWLSVAPMIELD